MHEDNVKRRINSTNKSSEVNSALLTLPRDPTFTKVKDRPCTHDPYTKIRDLDDYNLDPYTKVTNVEYNPDPYTKVEMDYSPQDSYTKVPGMDYAVDTYSSMREGEYTPDSYGKLSDSEGIN